MEPRYCSQGQSEDRSDVRYSRRPIRMSGDCDGVLCLGVVASHNFLIIVDLYIKAILGPRRAVEILTVSYPTVDPQGQSLQHKTAQVKSHKIKMRTPRTSQDAEP